VQAHRIPLKARHGATAMMRTVAVSRSRFAL